MNAANLALAERIIRGSSREVPADRLLRDTLRDTPGLSADDRSVVSHGVFCYFRWLGWLDANSPLRQSILKALGLAFDFAGRPETFSDEDLVARSVPGWAAGELMITPAYARSLQREPTLWLRARTGQANALQERLQGSRVFGRGLMKEALEYRGKEDLFRTPEFHAGEFEVQDLNSQAVGIVCAPAPGQTWWDACAGEGGKTLHLSDLMKNKGLIWASDVAEWRLQRLRRRAARAGMFNYRAVAWDGGVRPPTKTRFDGVLVDAPCTGTGTWQRNPHARWTTALPDVSELEELQIRILTHAAAGVKSGGKLVYAVCTLTRSETTGVTERFEVKAPEFEPLPMPNPFASSNSSVQLTLRPEDYGGNGMFIAAWRRAAG